MENKKIKNIELAKKDIFERVIYLLYGIFDCIEGIGTGVPDWNYDFKRIGNYEMISRLEIDKTTNNSKIIFQINDRANNHKNLFTWNYLFEKSKKDINFFKKLSEKAQDLDEEINEFDFYDEENNFDEVACDKAYKKSEKKREKILKEFPKEIFGEQFSDFEKTVNLILKNEYNKIYQLEDIKEEIFLDEKKDLTKTDFRIDYPPYDQYFLFFSTDKQKENLEIIGFYSFDVNELALKENKNIDFVSFSKYDFEEVKEYLENGKTLKDWLTKQLDALF